MVYVYRYLPRSPAWLLYGVGRTRLGWLADGHGDESTPRRLGLSLWWCSAELGGLALAPRRAAARVVFEYMTLQRNGSRAALYGVWVPIRSTE